MTVATACKFEYRCTRCFHSLYAPVEEAGTEQPCKFCGVKNLLPQATPDRIARAENLTEEPVVAEALETPLLFRDETLSDADLEREVKRQMYVAPGEMVCLSTMCASPWKRLLGAILDSFFAGLTFVVGAVLAFGLMSAGFISERAVRSETLNLDTINFLAALYLPFLGLALFQWNLIATQGQTLAKMLLGMRIVTDGGHMPGLVQGVILRNWVRFALSFIPFFSLIDVLFIFGESRRCIHDYMAGTYVVDV